MGDQFCVSSICIYVYQNQVGCGDVTLSSLFPLICLFQEEFRFYAENLLEELLIIYFEKMPNDIFDFVFFERGTFKHVRFIERVERPCMGRGRGF